MTRTARATHPRAILKDRSESRSGLDRGVKKDGAGAHSWGNPLEDPSTYVDEDDINEEETSTPVNKPTESVASTENPSTIPVPVPASVDGRRRVGSLSVSYTSEDIASAKEYRKGVFSGRNIDLSSIARTSPAVANPQNLAVSPSTHKSAQSLSSSESSATDEH